jgi:mercuric ion transport protein
VPRPDLRRIMPGGLAGLAGVACVACCVIPFLLAAGVLGGAGWAAAGRIMPGIAVALAAVAGGAWWWASRRRHASGCSGDGCSCGLDPPGEELPARTPLRSEP